MLLRNIYERVINATGQFQLYACSPASLELTYPVFTDAVRQCLGIYNRYKLYQDKVTVYATTWQYTFPAESAPDYVRSITPILLSGLTPYWSYDLWTFDRRKQSFIWSYDKETYTINIQYGGRFEVRGVWYHKLRLALAELLISNSTGIEIPASTRYDNKKISEYIAYKINSTLGTIFTATYNDDEVTITRMVNGACTASTLGNTGWQTPVVEVLGTAGTKQVTTFKCEALASNHQAAYLTLSSPTTAYHIWFNLDNGGGDPKQEQYYLDYISNEDYLFFDLCRAKFLQMLGASRNNFTLQGLEVQHSGASMVSEGQSLEDRVVQELKEKMDYKLGWN
jgi:hypothetical protein